MSIRTAEPEAARPQSAGVASKSRRPSPRRARFESSACLVFLTLLVAGIFWRHLFQGYTFPWDFTATSRWAVFVTSAVGSGNLSEWVPFVGGGFPLAECAVCGLYSPLWWAMGALHVPATVEIQTWIQVLHVLLGACGVFVLARTLGVRSQWALLAATAFTFFGGFYGNASHDVILRGHAYAPWVLWMLTLPADGRPWRRIVGFPVAIWVLATVGYPGQAVAFLLIGAVYLTVQLRLRPGVLRRTRPLIVPVAGASVAVLAAVYLPYMVADGTGRLYRPYPPDAPERAIWSLDWADLLFGLYLNPFAWDRVQATITSWSVGVVVLTGLTAAGRENLRRYLPLAAAGAVAGLLAALPAWLPAGRVIASIPLLFPSRLPASDYKAVAAIALAFFGAVGWQRIAGGHRPRWGPVLIASAVAAGLFLAPQSRSVPPTRAPLLVVAILAACVAVAYAGRRLPARAVLGAVLLLTIVEGARVISDLEILPGQKAWALQGDDFPQRELQNGQAVRLRKQLASPPASRPERALPLSPDVPGGTAQDSIGYLGTEYRLGDYGGTITMARHRIAQDARLTELMLRPWTAWVIPCSRIDCSVPAVQIPADLELLESPDVETVRYGADRIDYRVDLEEPAVMVENEIPAPGWSADRLGIRQVEAGGALRGWVLPAGSYDFTARYVQPERPAQLALAGAAIAGLLLTLLIYRRRSRELALAEDVDAGG